MDTKKLHEDLKQHHGSINLIVERSKEIKPGGYSRQSLYRALSGKRPNAQLTDLARQVLNELIAKEELDLRKTNHRCADCLSTAVKEMIAPGAEYVELTAHDDLQLLRHTFRFRGWANTPFYLTTEQAFPVTKAIIEDLSDGEVYLVEPDQLRFINFEETQSPT